MVAVADWAGLAGGAWAAEVWAESVAARASRPVQARSRFMTGFSLGGGVLFSFGRRQPVDCRIAEPGWETGLQGPARPIREIGEAGLGKADRSGCYDAPEGWAMAQVEIQDTPGARFRAAVREEKPLQVAGAINAFTARLAEATGFKALYLSGGGGAANSLGVPDLGISTM